MLFRISWWSWNRSWVIRLLNLRTMAEKQDEGQVTAWRSDPEENESQLCLFTPLSDSSTGLSLVSNVADACSQFSRRPHQWLTDFTIGWTDWSPLGCMDNLLCGGVTRWQRCFIINPYLIVQSYWCMIISSTYGQQLTDEGVKECGSIEITGQGHLLLSSASQWLRSNLQIVIRWDHRNSLLLFKYSFKVA